MAARNNKTAGLRVRALYKAHGLTQAQLAEILGYSDPNTVSMIINGRRSLTPEKALLLVEHFPEVSLDWLMGRSDYKTEGEQALTEAAAHVSDLDAFAETLCFFLDGTPYSLLTPAEIQKLGDGSTSSPTAEYVFFKKDEALALSSPELDCLMRLIQSQISSQLDYLFRQKSAIAQDMALRKKLRELKLAESKSKGGVDNGQH